ncbi:MAG: Jag N-terminal domain-containing protein [Acidimicrobiales bacterium]|nr:Jag N-terminal domain-containing protein [Acidimicrobiales bacterium]
MEWIETTGATVDDAKERALDRLGVAEDELEYEILAEASRSMLGLKKTDARLRARVRPREPRQRVERRDRDRSRGRRGDRSRAGKGKGNGRNDGGQGDGNKQRGDQAKKGDGNKQRGDQAKPGDGDSKRADRAKPSAGSPDGDSKETSSSRRRGRGSGVSGEAGTGVESTSDDRASVGRDEIAPDPAPKGEQMELETQSEIVEAFVAGLLDEMGLDARVVSTIEDDRLSVEAQGLNLGLAIGHRGETVRAITEIARTIVQRRSEGDAVGFLSVDVGGYRERRRTFLEEFARNQADAVLDDGRARALEPMGSADRKVIHDTVSEIDGVETESEGSDRDRRVVIRPVVD